jgi:26S proteasome regulatory subunit N2
VLPRIRESLYEDDNLPLSARASAALLASKVYYCLGEYDEALSFALGSGSAFHDEYKTPGSGEYVETVICMSVHTPWSPHFSYLHIP